MAKNAIPFELFLVTVPEEHRDFATNTHKWMAEKGYTIKIAEAKNGYVVSYNHPKTKYVLFNYVFRKKGMIMRIYADNINAYMDFLETLPETMVKDIVKAPNCRRLLSPDQCNPNCRMGYDFIMNGERHKKCRMGAFMILMDEETKPVLNEFLNREAEARS